jgi:hypothetical protein
MFAKPVAIKTWGRNTLNVPVIASKAASNKSTSAVQ